MNVRRLCLVLIGALTFALVPAAAQAQLPVAPPVPVPEVPQPDPVQVPQQVQDAMMIALITGLGPAYTVAAAAIPAATAAGFALRPACAAINEFTLVSGLVSGYVIVPAGAILVLGPALIMCYGAALPGPADPVLAQVDDAVGPQFSDIYATALYEVQSSVLTQVPSEAAIAYGEIYTVCIVPALFGNVFAAMPPPTERVKPFQLFCG